MTLLVTCASRLCCEKCWRAHLCTLVFVQKMPTCAIKHVWAFWFYWPCMQSKCQIMSLLWCLNVIGHMYYYYVCTKNNTVDLVYVVTDSKRCAYVMTMSLWLCFCFEMCYYIVSCNFTLYYYRLLINLMADKRDYFSR